MTAEQIAQLAEKDAQIAFLADRLAALEAAKAASVPPVAPADPEVIKRAVDAEMAKLKARFSAVVARTDATASRVGKSTDPGGDLLTEALARARAEAQERADAASGPKTPGYWKRALAALGERLAADLPPSAQMQAALRSEEGKLLLASMERNVGQGETR